MILFVATTPAQHPSCIGIAQNHLQRLADLQAGNPHTLELHWHHEVIHPRAVLDLVRHNLQRHALTPGWFAISATLGEYACRNAILEVAGSNYRHQPPPIRGPLSAAIVRATASLGPWPSMRRNPEGFRLYRKTLAAYLLTIERRSPDEIAPVLQTV